MKKTITIIALSISFLCSVIAQKDIYYSPTATLQVNGEFEGGRFFGQTKELKIKLDYETTKIDFRFFLHHLELNIDSLNNLLDKNHLEVLFDGELSLDYITTENHPPLDFIVEGWLSVGDSKTKVRGEGKLNHIDDSGRYTCMLGMTIFLNLDKLNMEIPPGLHNEIEVIITQALLERDKN